MMIRYGLVWQKIVTLWHIPIYGAEQAIEIYHRVKDYVVALRKAHDLLIEKYPGLLMTIAN
jgi:hypothetical protein